MPVTIKRAAKAEATAVPEMLTVPDVAGALRLSRRQVWRLIKSNELRVHRLGRSVRISLPDLHAYLADQVASPLPATPVNAKYSQQNK